MRSKSILVLVIVCLFVYPAQDCFANEINWATIDKPGASNTYAYGIDGENIVGFYRIDAYDSHGFLYDGSTWTTLDAPGVSATYAYDIDADIIVGSTSSAIKPIFIYDESTWTWTFLRPAGTSQGGAYGISGNYIVGYYRDAVCNHGFIYDGLNITTFDAPGALNTYAYGIDGDNIVGSYHDGSNYHGFLYDGSTWTTLDMPGAAGTHVKGIDGCNIVGYYYGIDGFSSGFLYDGSTWTTLDMPGAVTTRAFGIDGLTIVGDYRNEIGSGYHGFVYEIPEPATPPVADADGPYVIYVGDTLTLDASGSTDDDNDIVSYMWDLDDNNSFETDTGGQAIFDVNYTYLQSLGLLINYTYNIHLKVTDSEAQSDVADSTLIIVPKPATVVAVDIKPGSCPNPVNVKSSGVLPVAILGTEDVNVITIDPTSVRLAGVEPLRSGFEDVAGPVSDSNDCNCTTDGPDGFLDLTLKFETQRIVEAIGDVNHGDVVVLELTGVLFDPIPYETPIEGADCILIKGKHKAHNKADINKDGIVNSVDFAILAESWLESSIVEE